MVKIPNQPPNSDVIGKDGQFKQELLRYWDSVAKTSASAIQSFNEFFALDEDATPDISTDYLLAYDVSASAAKRVPMSAVASKAGTVIETKAATASTSIAFTNIPQTYRRLQFRFTGISKNAASGAMVAEFSDDNGSSYATSGVSGAVSADIGGGAAVAGWASGLALIFYADNTVGANGFMSIDEYGDAATISKRIVSGGNRGSTIRANGSGDVYGLGPINAVQFTLNNFTANGSIVLIGYP